MPLLVFLLVACVFLAVQLSANIIRINYNSVHYLFGLAFPLLLGYIPIQIFRWNGLKKFPINYGLKWSWYWSLRVGVLATALMSAINEMIDDPETNGISFLNAWHHFAFDMAGLLTFIVVCSILEKLFLNRPNKALQATPKSGTPELER